MSNRSRPLLRSPAFLLAIVASTAIAAFGISLMFAVFGICSAMEEDEYVLETTEVVRASDPLLGGGCDHLVRENGSELGLWTHDMWIDLSKCFDKRGELEQVQLAAAQGLTYFPESERLHNIRGVALIEMEEFARAVDHYRVSLQAVGQPTNDVMENNLAWAGLFASDRMTLSEARRHYRNALTRSRSCETLHTGMWVEYAVASRSARGSSRAAAIKRYDELRSDYESCIGRLGNGTRLVAYEVAGAGILDAEMHKLTMIQMFELDLLDDGFRPLEPVLVERSLPIMNITPMEIDEACADIAPVRSALPACRKTLREAF